MKKNNKPVNDYVYDTMVGLTNQISLSLYDAYAKTTHKDLVQPSELQCAKIRIEYSWNEIEKTVDSVRKEFHKLLNNRQWTKAESLLLKYKNDLNEYKQCYISKAIVAHYVLVGLRDKVNRSMVYNTGCNGLTFGDKGDKIIIDQSITDSESLEAFWKGICDLYSYANLIAEQMKVDLNDNQYIEKLSKNDKPTIGFLDLCFTYEGMNKALSMLDQLNVLKWNGSQPYISIQDLEMKNADEKPGKGIKRFLGAWLYYCKNNLGLMKFYNDTLIATVVLRYFGIPCENENAVREMIGDQAQESDYHKMFKTQFALKM